MITTRTLRGLVAAVFVAFIVSGVFAQAPATSSKPAAIVNGEAISLEEVDAILKCRSTGPTKLTESDRREMQLEALNMLVDDLIIQQFLRKHAPAARPAEVNQKLKELQASLKAQGQTLEDYCRESGQTEPRLRANIATMLQRNAYIASHLNDTAVRKYFDENREFFDQILVHASHILLRLSSTSTPTERAAALAKLQAVRKEIMSGKLSFEEAAKRYSQCSSAPNGGDIGYFPRKGVVEEVFAKAAFALNKDEVSDVVQTSYGLHLIKVIDHKSGPPSDFKKIEAKVRELAGEAMMLDILAEERQAARVEVKLGEGKGTEKAASNRRPLFSR